MGSVKKPTKKLSDYSSKELEELRVQRIKHMTTQMESLQVEADYTKLKADIIENRYREHLYKVKYAELVNIPSSEEKDEGKKPPKAKQS